MKSNLRKALALLLTLIMVMTSLPTSALAEMVTDLAKSVTDVSEGKQLFGDAFVSPLSIVDDDKNNYTTYTFRNEKGEEVDKQIVKNGDTLYEPASPEKEGYKFVGWYNGETKFNDFGEQSGITATTDVTLTAKFKEARYVFFMDQNNRVFETREGINGTTIQADATFPVGADEGITGWYTDADQTNRVDSVTIDNANITLYPKVEKGHWITFDSVDGTYVKPAFYLPGEKTVQPENVTKPGYDLNGWVEDGAAFNFGQPLQENITLKAQWKARSDTKYTVIYWQENANDDKYAFADYEVLTGTTGTQTKATAKKSYEGFTAQTITQKTIEGDGSTIVNVYYKRNVYNVKFYRRSNRKWVEDTSLRITAKYGAKIGDKWPTVSGSSAWSVSSGYSWDGSLEGPFQVNIDTMPLNGASFYGPNTASGTETAYYYVEVLPGEKGTETKNDVSYKLHHSDTSAGRGYIVTQEDKYDIEGFTYKEGTSNGSSYNNAKFYYTRNSYDIVFMNNGAKDNTITRKYEQNISDANYKPSTPATLTGYSFGGWYDNELGEGEAFDFTGTMPARNITLYARWNPPTVSGTAHKVMTGGDNPKELTIAYGGKVNKDDLPTPTAPDGDGWEFVCWATMDADGNFTPFNFETIIYENIVLYPYYVNSTELTITYDVNGDTTVVADARKYAVNAYADVFAAPTAAAPAGKVFLGWNTQAGGKGTMYQPGDKVKMTADVTLYAIWGDQAATTSLIYHANFGDPEQTHTDSNIKNNAKVTVSSYAATKMTTRPGYTFKGWAESRDETVVKYRPGAEVRLDGTTNNDLYAVWEVINGTLTVKKVVNLYGDDNWKNADFSKEEFTFTLTGDGVSKTFDLKDGQSSEPFTVPYGTYTITETPKNGWTADTASKTVTLNEPAKKVTFTNRPAKDSTEVTVRKEWKDETEEQGHRPPELNLIYRGTVDGTTVYEYPVTLTAGGDWKLTIPANKLPTMYNGKTISYALVEVNVPDGYVQEEDSDPKTVTNVRSGEIKDVVFYKDWDDSNNAAGYRPEQNEFAKKLTLTRSTTNGAAVPVAVQPTITGDTYHWTISYGALPQYNAQGQRYTYTLTEGAIENYTVIGSNEIGVGETITNKLNVGTLKITKQVAGVATTTDVFTIVVTNTASNKTATVTLTNGESESLTLPIGTYTVAETEIKGTDGGTPQYWYTKPAAADYTVKAGEVTTVTLTNKVDMTAVSGTKTWKDDNDSQNKRPNSITINLLRGRTKIDSKTVTADDGWTWSFDNLPAKNPADGNLYDYTITENEVAGYKSDCVGKDNVWNVTNTLSGKYDVGAVSFTKEWIDESNAFGLRPTINSGEVSFKLQRRVGNGAWAEVATNLTIAVGEVANTWTISNAAKLDIYDENGVKYQYRIVETNKNDAYTVEQSTAVFGTTDKLQNKLVTASLTVEKVWFGAAQQQATVKVSATGLEAQTIVLNAANDWQQTITLPKQDKDGNVYTYTVKEDAIPGYKTYYTANDAVTTDKAQVTLAQNTTVTITNAKLETVRVNKKWVRTPANKREEVSAKLTYNDPVTSEKISVDITLNDANSWKAEVSLPEDGNGTLVQYEVVETKPTTNFTANVVLSADRKSATITNTYDEGTTAVRIWKSWDRPAYFESVGATATFTLMRSTDGENWEAAKYADGEPVEARTSTEIATDAKSSWSSIISSLPLYDENGQTYTYKVVETMSANSGYAVTSAAEQTVAAGGTVTFTNTKEQNASLTIVKKARDVNGRELTGKDAPTFTFVVKRGDNDNIAATVTVKAGETKTVEGLVPGEYTVEEKNVKNDVWAVTSDKEGNKVTARKEGGETITFTNTRVARTITVTKVWVDGEDKYHTRSDATFTLQQSTDGTNWSDVESKPTQGTVSFTVPTHTENGTKILYQVTESHVPGYRVDAETKAVPENGRLTFTNTLLMNVTVTKTWETNGVEVATTPGLTFTLYDGETTVATQPLAEGSDNVVFTNVPYSESYTVGESDIKGGSIQFVGPNGRLVTDNAKGYFDLSTERAAVTMPEAAYDDGTINATAAFTNTAKVGAIKVSKTVNLNNTVWTGAYPSFQFGVTWVDDNNTTHEVKLNLQPDATSQTVVSGQILVPLGKDVTVTETPETGWVAASPEIKVISGETVQTAAFTNTRETTTINGRKIWVGDAQNSIQLYVLRNGEKMNADTPITVDLAENGSFTISEVNSKNLAKYDENGHAYTYTLVEAPVPGYTTTYSEDRLTITNTRTSGLTLVKTGDIDDEKFDASISVKGGSKITTGKIGLKEPPLTVPTAESGKTYVFSETQKTGWYLKSATVKKNDGEAVNAVIKNGTSVEVTTQAGDNIVVTFENQPQTGSFTVNKTNVDGKQVADAEFTLYDGTGKKVADATTNNDGVATFSGIAIGSYTLKETKAPTGYVASNAQYTVDVTGNEKNLKDATVTIKGEDGNAIESLTVMNAYDVHSFTLKKVVNDDTWAVNADAEFDFTVKFENTTHKTFAVNYNGKKTDAVYGVVTISDVKLKNNGSATFDGLPYGTAVTITESANANTWTTTWSSNAKAGETSDKTASATVEGEPVTVTATNRRVTTEDEKDRKIELVKNWDDEGYEAYRPKSITIAVFAKSGNGEYKTTGLTQRLDVTSDPQTYEISSVDGKRLAMYDLAGNEYQYELREIKIGAHDVDTEGKAQGYTYTQDSCDGTKTEITNAIATKNVEVTKEWVDAFENTQNFFGLRPGVEAFAQKVSLYRSTDSQKWALHSDTTATKRVTEDGIHYTIKFEGLPQYDAQGNEIDYRVVESPVEHYNTELPTDATNVGSGLMGVANGATITNTLATGSLTIEKVVVDPTEANEGDTASFTFTVKSEKDKTITRTLTFDLTKTGENDRKQIVPIDGLPYGTYTVTEAANDAWKTTVGSTETNTAEVPVSKETEAKVTFTNARNLYNNDDGKIKVTKNWVRIGTEAYPDVTFELWQQLGEAEVLYQTLTLSGANVDADGKISGEFTNVPKYALDGKTEYVYDVTEEPVPGYDQTSGSPNTEKTEWTFTNERLEAGAIQITKIWEDDSDKFGLRPSADDFKKYVTLARKTEKETGWKLFNWDSEVKDLGGNRYSVKFSGMPQTDAAGKVYLYRVVEYKTMDKASNNSYYTASGEGYMAIVGSEQAMYAWAANGKTITNTLKTETLTIKKVVEGYVGDATGNDLTFSFTISPSDNKVKMDKMETPTITVKPTERSAETYVTLPAGEYTVTENHNDAWTVSVSHDDTVAAGEPTPVPAPGTTPSPSISSSATLRTGYTVTFYNTRNMFNGDGKYTVVKNWQRYDENEAFPNVTIELSDGARTRSSVELKSEDVQVDGQNASLGSISHIFENLPAYDLEGKELTYTATESYIPGYTAGEPVSSDASTTFTNTANSIVLMVNKLWQNGDGTEYMGERPESVTVKLWRAVKDGEPMLYTSRELNADNDWTCSFTVPTHNAGSDEYIYSVSEDPVTGFELETTDLTFVKNEESDNPYSVTLVNQKTMSEEVPSEKTVEADFKTVQITDDATGKMVEDGAQLTYTITYFNHFSDPKTIVITDTLNENVVFESADNGGSYDADRRTVKWEIPNVQPGTGDKVELTVRVALTDEAKATSDPKIPNTATVNIGNDATQTAESENVTVYNPRLTVEKITANVPAKGYYALGETAEFKITASNTGNVLLENIVITEQLEGAQFVQSGDYTVENGKAIIAALNPGQSVVVRAQYTVKLDDLYAEDDQQQAPMKNIVTATAQSGDDPVDGGDESEFKPDQLTHLTVEKHWADDLAVQRGDVRVQLTADGESYTADSRYDHEVIISSEDNLSPADENVWVMEFDNLPKHNADGSEIRYSAVETHVDGHGTVTDGRCDGYDVTVADDPDAHTTVITNTAQRKKFIVRKVWMDGEGNLAESLIPDTELTVALFVDGFDMNDDDFRTTLTRANGWEGEIDRMFAYNQAGVAYEYTPMEMDANGNAIADGGSIVIDGVTYDVSITTQTEPDANRAEAHRDVTVTVTNTRRGDDPEENKPTKEANLAPGKTTVSVGDSLTYTISYHNSRNVKADVTITDVLAESLNFGSASHGGTYDPATRTVTWVLRDVAAFASDAVTLTVTVNEKAKQADDAAVVKNTATVVIPGNKADIRYDTNTVDIPVEPEEGVKPTKKAVGIDPAKDTVEIGQKVEYRIGYRNHKNTAVSVRIVDKLDDGVKFISASDGGVYDAAKHTVFWNIAKLAPFADGEVTLTVEVTEAARKLADRETMATVNNTATVKFDNDPETETNVVDIPVKPNDPKKPEKKAEGLNATDTKKVGDEIVYTITYVNNLNKKAKVVVTDALDEGVDFVEADNGGVYDKASHTVTWTFDSVDPFEGDAVKLTVKVNEKARQIKEGETTATVDNTAAVTVDNKTTTISDPVEIPVTPDKPTDPTKKADDKALNSFGKIAVGDQLPFTVSYVNNLNTVATVTVRDTLEEGLTFVSADNGGTYDEATRTVTWVLKDVAPFTSGSVTVITEVNENAVDAADPTVANSAVVKIGDQPEQTTEPAEVTVYNPDFSVEKKLTNLPAKGYFTAGETAAFDITVKNTGNVPLENVAVEELLDGVTFVQGEGYTVDGRIATIAALPIGEQIVLKAEYTVIEADLGNTDLANRITVRGETPENPDDPDQPHNPEDKGDEEPIPVDECVEITGTKTWNDADNAYGARPDVIQVMLLANGEEKIGTSASAETEWKYTFIQQPKHDADGNEVVYSIREEEVPGYDTTYSAEGYDITNTLRRHTLTIRYWVDEVGGEQAFKTFTRDYYYGERYNVVSPAMDGYRADHEVVSGRIEGDLEVDVVYTAILWRLNIRYRRVGDGKTLAPMYTNGNVIIGDAYEVESPVIPGYTADRPVVKGEMHGRNMSFTVWYTPEQTEVVIVDEKTPFGLGNVVMNAGDCFE